MFDVIAKPFGMLLLWLYNLVQNYGVAIFLFALVVKLILLPFQMKSKKSMMRMAALNPQVEALKKRHEGNPQRLQQETSKLYREEHVNPMSGCLWSLLPYPILLALWRAIRFPLTTMMGVAQELVSEGGAIYSKLAELGFDLSGNGAYLQLQESEFITRHFADFSGLSDKLVPINYQFLGLNLAETPSVTFWTNGVTWAAFGLFLIPLVSAGLSYLQMKVSTAMNPAAQQGQQQMKSMNFIMPLISLWIGFSMPASMGVYWIFTSLLALVQEIILNRFYGKKLEAEQAERNARFRAREAEYERKRAETERLRAEGQTRENENTSRKKQVARQKAAAAREEQAKQAKGAKPKDVPPSQVGTRRYARGRAYDPDRFQGSGVSAEAEQTEDAVSPAAPVQAPAPRTAPYVEAEEEEFDPYSAPDEDETEASDADET